MISLRRLTPADAPLLSSVGGSTLIQSHGHSAPAEVMQDYVDRSFTKKACRQELSDDKNIFYGIFYNDQPAGYLKIVFAYPHPDVPLQPVTKLERLYLLKEFYALKLGQKLMQLAIDLSKKRAEKGMWLEVWKGNERAIRFYQKQGFKTVGETRFMLTAMHANPAWVMLLQYQD